MTTGKDILAVAVVSAIVSLLVASIVIISIQPGGSQSTSSTIELNKTVERLSNDISSLRSTLSSLDASIKTISSQVSEVSRKLGDVEKANAELGKQLSGVRESVVTLSTEVSNMRTEFEKAKAYQILKVFMVDSGSNIATVLASQITDIMDQQGQIPSIFGYGKDQIKGAIRDTISTLLRSLIPSSAWTEHSATKTSANVYATSLKTAFPIKLNVFGVDVNIARVIVIATGDVNVASNSVSNLRVTSVSLS